MGIVRASDSNLFLRLRDPDQIGTDPRTRCPTLMRRLDILHVPDILDNNVYLPVSNQSEERIDIRHERRLVPRDVEEGRLPVREDLRVLEQELGHAQEAVAGRLRVRERLLVLAVRDEDTLFLAAAAGRQDLVGLLPAGGA